MMRWDGEMGDSQKLADHKQLRAVYNLQSPKVSKYLMAPPPVGILVVCFLCGYSTEMVPSCINNHPTVGEGKDSVCLPCRQVT
mmetsp:Transcript_18187/g.42101  ORF Transcript_18187/g.42101 Transcript_18187/m.42101 type:complete len:83 (+) Transcript_18187:628-876(+)